MISGIKQIANGHCAARARTLGRGRRRISGAAAYAVENLEERRLLSTITWINPAGGSFTDPNNWSGGVAPSNGDTAIINTSGITVTVPQGVNIDTLQCKANLDLSAALTVNAGSSSVSGSLTFEINSAVQAIGAGTSFTATGATTLNAYASVYAQTGAAVALPTLTSISATGTESFAASGGGTIDISNLTSLNSPGNYLSVVLNAGQGGKINASQLPAINNTYMTVYADGTGSIVDLSKVASVTESGGAYVSINATNSGQVKLPLLTAPDHVNVTIYTGGSVPTSQWTSFTNATLDSAVTLDLSQVADITNSSITARAGATLALPKITSYTASSGGASFIADGGGILDLSNLTSVSDPNAFISVRAGAGGQVKMGQLAAINNTYFSADAHDLGSVLDLSKLATINNGASGPYVNLNASNNGQLKAPLLTTLDRVNVTINTGGILPTSQWTSFTNAELSLGQTVDLSKVADIAGSNLAVSSGATIALPKISSYTETDGTLFQAQDMGTILDLSHLTSISAPNNFLTIRALNGAVVNLSTLPVINNSYVGFEADGAGSVLDLSKLASISNGSSGPYVNFGATNSGQIKVPLLTMLDRVNLTTGSGGVFPTGQLTAFTHATLSVGQTSDFGALNNITGSNVYATSGAQVSLPNVTSFTVDASGGTLQAQDAGSLLDLSHLTTISSPNQFASINAFSGAQVNVSSLAAINQSYVQVQASSSGSIVDLSKLATINEPSPQYVNFSATSMGQIKVPLLTTTDRVNVTINSGGVMDTAQLTSFTNGTLDIGGNYNFSGLSDVDGASLIVREGGSLALPKVTSYTESNGATFQSGDTGSLLDLSHLTSISTGNANLYINASGGKVDLSKLPAVNNAYVQFNANAAGGVLDLSSLATLSDTSPYSASVSATGGGIVHLGSGDVMLSGTNVYLDATSTISGGNLHLLDGAMLSGSGTVAASVINHSGTVNAGYGGYPGILTITGNYTQDPCATLMIPLFGTTVGTGYGQLNVTGAASIFGTLSLEVSTGLSPSQGTQFDMLAAHSESGFFTAINSTGLVNPNIQLDPLYVESGPMAGVVLQADAVGASAFETTTVGDGTAQRSEVRQLTVKFSSAVTLSPGAFTLYLSNDGGSGTSAADPSNMCNAPTDATVALGTPASSDGGVTWTIPILANTAFTDKTGSLNDGIYYFTVHGAHAATGGNPISNSDITMQFHRLFGDVTGAKTVNNGDYLKFKQAYLSSVGNAKYNAAFDYDANGVINNSDFLQFKKRYLKVFTY